MSEATRIEQALHKNKPINYDVIPVIKGCIQGYAQIYSDISFVLKSKVNQCSISGSADHFAQLLDKIIANAVDFSCDQKVEIEVFTKSNHLNILISNNGNLLPCEMESQLFDSMISVRPSELQQQPHLGMGLYIARLICEFHQGQISAINKMDNSGVQFIIKVPVV